VRASQPEQIHAQEIEGLSRNSNALHSLAISQDHSLTDVKRHTVAMKLSGWMQLPKGSMIRTAPEQGTVVQTRAARAVHVQRSLKA